MNIDPLAMLSRYWLGIFIGLVDDGFRDTDNGEWLVRDDVPKPQDIVDGQARPQSHKVGGSR